MERKGLATAEKGIGRKNDGKVREMVVRRGRKT